MFLVLLLPCYFMKKKTLYLHISVTILFLWESEEREYESSGRCRLQGRGRVNETCVLARTNVKQFIKFLYMIIYRRRCKIALTVYLKTSVRQISPTNQGNGRLRAGLQLLVSSNTREVPHFPLYIFLLPHQWLNTLNKIRSIITKI